MQTTTQQQIGTEVELSCAVVAGRPPDQKNAISWQAEDNLPRTVGIQLDVNDTAVLGARIAVVAVVTWGVLGAKYTAEVDTVHGVAMSVYAENVRVDFRYDGDNAAASTIRARASIGFGGVIGGEQTVHPTRSFFNTNLGAASPLVIVIPKFARSVDFLRSNFAASTFSVDFQDATGANTLGTVIVAPGTQLVREIQVPQGSRVMILNDIGATTTRITIIFALNL